MAFGSIGMKENFSLFDFKPDLEADYTSNHKPLNDPMFEAYITPLIDAVDNALIDMGYTKDDKRPLKANGAAGILAKGMLNGKFFSVQEAIEYLRAHGKVSNSPDKRMREARNWLTENGYEIEAKEKETCLAWGIKRNLAPSATS